MALSPALLQAQGSGSVSAPSGGPNYSPGLDGIEAPFVVTKQVTATLISTANGVLLLEVKGKKITLQPDKKVRIRADKNTELAGQKNLKTEDLLPGMLVKVVYRADDNVAIDIRIAKDKAS